MVPRVRTFLSTQQIRRFMETRRLICERRHPCQLLVKTGKRFGQVMVKLKKELVEHMRDLPIQPVSEFAPRLRQLPGELPQDARPLPEQGDRNQAYTRRSENTAGDVKHDDFGRQGDDCAQRGDPAARESQLAQIGALNAFVTNDIGNAELPKLVTQPLEDVKAVGNERQGALPAVFLPLGDGCGEVVRSCPSMVKLSRWNCIPGTWRSASALA
jgi:hypothetical protein